MTLDDHIALKEYMRDFRRVFSENDPTTRFDIPTTLKAVLWNRFEHWVGNNPSEFIEYLERYVNGKKWNFDREVFWISENFYIFAMRETISRVAEHSNTLASNRGTVASLSMNQRARRKENPRRQSYWNTLLSAKLFWEATFQYIWNVAFLLFWRVFGNGRSIVPD